MTAALLELQGLACERSGRALFSGVNLQLRPGELLRVQGANGAGKTSLLRMLCGLLEPSSGRVLWRGEEVSALREEFGGQLIYLGHAAALKDDLSPLENLLAACQLAGSRVAEADAMRALAAAGLRGHETTLVRRLSQGQRRRSALARLALLPAAALWVLDEPFNALDVGAVAWLCGLVRRHLQNAGLVVLTSHQDAGIDGVAQQVLAL
jgi:heme exporter protein A